MQVRFKTPDDARTTEEWIGMAEDSELAVWRDLWRAVSIPVAAEAGMHCAAIGSGVALMMEKCPTWFFNRVLGLGVRGEASESDIERLIGLYGAKGLEFAVSLGVLARPRELAAWLEKRGFEVVNVWAKMVRGAEAAREPGTGLKIEEVGAERSGPVGEILCAGFGAPPMLKPIFGAALRSASNHAYMAFDGDAPVAVGMLSIRDGVGHLHSDATLAPYRGRGIQGAIMARRLRDGAALGCTAFATETGLLSGEANPSYHNMLRCGFRKVCERPNYLQRRRAR
jgi:hypothetical protein